MERFDFEEEPQQWHAPRLNILDLLTGVVLLATLAIGAFMVYVFVNPSTPYNPLKPNIPTPFRFPTATITPLQLEATWTPTPVIMTETATFVPTITLQPSPTLFSLVPPTKTPPATSTPKSPYGSTVSAIDSTLIHPEFGCAWNGIGGTVKDASNADVVGMVLKLSGSLDGKLVNAIAVSGQNPDYGISGFEFKLGIAPVASNKLLTLQLLDQSGNPQASVLIITYNDCKKNLILVRFKKNG